MTTILSSPLVAEGQGTHQMGQHQPMTSFGQIEESDHQGAATFWLWGIKEISMYQDQMDFSFRLQENELQAITSQDQMDFSFRQLQENVDWADSLVLHTKKVYIYLER